MLGTNLHISKAKYKAPDQIDYVEIMDGDTRIKLIDENSASGAVLENNKEVDIIANGVVTINPSVGKDAMKKVTATVNVPTAAELEDNKAATIDASTYVSPVEITPTAGKDGMKKATITVSNIPEAVDVESNKAATIDASTYTQPVEITPTSGKDAMEKATVTITNIPVLQANKEVAYSLTTTFPVEVTPASGKDAMEKVTISFNPDYKNSVKLPGFTAVDQSSNTKHFVVMRTTGDVGPWATTVTQVNQMSSYWMVCLEDHVCYRKDSYSAIPYSTGATVTYSNSATWDVDTETSVLTITLGDTTTAVYNDFAPADINLGLLIGSTCH